jgi:hypothetical protein
VYFSDYAADNSVWIAWRFYSDYSVTYQGSWVDDIRIWKYVPGQITVTGSFHYFDRNDFYLPARLVKVYLYDQDVDGTDDLVAGPVTTQADGSFQFPTIRNWDVDDSDPDQRLDLYVVWETDSTDTANAQRRVTNFGDWAYKWRSETRSNISDGSAQFHYDIPNGDAWEGAMWIFQDMRQAWEYVWNHTTPSTDAGSVTARWEPGSNSLAPCFSGSCFYPGPGGPQGIFIADTDKSSAGTVFHEIGHQYMYTMTDGWWYNSPTCWYHEVFKQSDVSCAWSEGWAEFFAVISGPDGLGYIDIETPTWPAPGDQRETGETVEGRVAGALYDLWDITNDGWDQIGFGFDPIHAVVFVYTPNRFSQFWDGWKSRGLEKHFAVQSIYQNTIDYDTPPRFNNLPNPTLLQGITYNHAVDLWAYAYDPESANSQLTYAFVSSTDVRCGASVDSHYVNFALQSGWVGSCGVTVRVRDVLNKYADGTFTVTVVPVASRIFLPMILK